VQMMGGTLPDPLFDYDLHGNFPLTQSSLALPPANPVSCL
jgi:hypothetical protein